MQALTEVAKLRSGMRILIHGGAGGNRDDRDPAPSTAWSRATATKGGIDYARQVGADRVVDYKREDFVRGGRQYDVVLDTIGGDTYKRSFEVLVRDGVIVSLKQPVDLELMKLHGVKAFFQLTRTTAEHLDPLRRLIDENVVKVHVERTFPLDRIQDALIVKEQGHVHSKIGIEIRPRRR